MRAIITPFRVAASILGALVLALVILLKVSWGYYLLLPDIAHPVAPLVHVAGGKPPTDGGNLFFVDVREVQANSFDRFAQWVHRGSIQWIHPHSSLIPADALIPPGSNNQQVIKAELRQMASSQHIAAAVALRYLGYHVVVRTNGVLVGQILLGTDAAGKLQPTDVIVGVNGRPTLTKESLLAVMANVKPGQTVTLRVLRGRVTKTVQVRTTNDHGRALIGIGADQSVEIGKLPIKVSIDAGGIGGPSAGLAFTLELLRLLGRNVTHGYTVAATGEIHIDGTVSAIGGVKQKTWGVREAGAQIFLVPKDQGNASLARKFAGPDVKIIAVTSFEQALRALAALPKLSKK